MGVFALAFPLAARLGAAAAGALGYFVALSAAMCLVLLLGVYPVAVVAGRIPLRRFARAAAPAQAVAFGSRSSLASLPALIDGSERHLGLPPAVTGFCLPLAVSTFKFGAPVVMLVGLLVMGRLYGVPIDAPQLAHAAAASVLLSFASPGVPGGALLVAAPIFATAGVPLEALAILLAADTIPDMFRAPANVTADLAVAAVLARHAPAPAQPGAPAPVSRVAAPPGIAAVP